MGEPVSRDFFTEIVLEDVAPGQQRSPVPSVTVPLPVTFRLSQETANGQEIWPVCSMTQHAPSRPSAQRPCQLRGDANDRGEPVGCCSAASQERARAAASSQPCSALTALSPTQDGPGDVPLAHSRVALPVLLLDDESPTTSESSSGGAIGISC
jgi:hypothetical protein